VAAAVVGDHAISVLAEEQHLSLPGIAGERPSVGKQDWLSIAPVLVGNREKVMVLASCFGVGDGWRKRY